MAPTHDPLDILIVSPGGMGCTYVHHQVAAAMPSGWRTNCPDDTDGLKHLASPSMLTSGVGRVLYVWNDPLLALLSLNRRGYTELQQGKLACPPSPPGALPPPGWDGKARSLDQLLAAAEDHLCDISGISRHAARWLTWGCGPTSPPMHVVDLRHIDNLGLSAFLGFNPNLARAPRRVYDLTAISDTARRVYADLDAAVTAYASRNPLS